MASREFRPTERIGINAVERVVLDGLHWIWREQPVSDFGIDGHIEAVADDGTPTGKLFAVQVKTGASYFTVAGDAATLYVDEAHVAYWDGHVLPVIVVLHNPDDGCTIWQWADLKSARPTEKGWRIPVPRDKAFVAASKDELLDRSWSDDGVGLRRRFALDRSFMAEFVDREAFVSIDQWVNKSLRFREIEIRFDDPDADEPDYTIPIMATWHYEVLDIMRHFLPWLDYEELDQPEDMSGEIEGHVMSASLSKPALAFLELEAFFDGAADVGRDAPLDLGDRWPRRRP
jgi:hypothetical protein